MRIDILRYAEKQINLTGAEDGIRATILSGGERNSLYLEVASGKSYKLSDEEISYQAQPYFESEIQSIF